MFSGLANTKQGPQGPGIKERESFWQSKGPMFFISMSCNKMTPLFLLIVKNWMLSVKAWNNTGHIYKRYKRYICLNISLSFRYFWLGQLFSECTKPCWAMWSEQERSMKGVARRVIRLPPPPPPPPPQVPKQDTDIVSTSMLYCTGR